MSVRDSGIDGAGQGLFAAKDFGFNELIGYYWGSVGVQEQQTEHINNRAITLMDLNKNVTGGFRLVIVGDLGSTVTYCNHKPCGKGANAELVDTLQCTLEQAEEYTQIVRDILAKAKADEDPMARRYLEIPFHCAVMSSMAIKKGEEIFVDYGDMYGEEFGSDEGDGYENESDVPEPSEVDGAVVGQTEPVPEPDEDNEDTPASAGPQ